MSIVYAIVAAVICIVLCWAFAKVMLHFWPSDGTYDFYGPTVEEKPDINAFDEPGKAFLRKWHEDFK